jgi:hypothetical protein
MKMADVAPGNRLHCGSEALPFGMSRDTMYFLEQRNGYFVFACKLCTEIQRRPQIHVVSAAYNGREIYRNARKADFVDRDNQGRIVSFR